MDTMTVEAPASAPAATPLPASSEPTEVKVIDEREQEARAESQLDDKLAKIFREAKRDRAEDGKFAGKETKPAKDTAPKEEDAAKALATETPDPKPVKAPEAKAETTETPPEKPASKVAPPGHWGNEVKAKWDGLPPDVAKEISEAALKDRQAITKLGQYAQNAKPIVDTLSQFRDTFESKGLSYEAGLTQLLKAQQALDSDPVAGIAQIAEAYGINLASLANVRGGDPHAEALSKQLAEARQEINDLKSRVISKERQEQEAGFDQLAEMTSRLAQELEGFDHLVDDMEPIIVAIKRGNPNMSDEAVLKEAYDRAAWGNPKFRQTRLEKETKVAEEKRAAESRRAAEDARRAGVLNVESEPGSAQPTDLDDLLRNTFRKSNRK